MSFKFSPHIAVQVKNYAKAIEFYRDTLGMSVNESGDGEAELKCGDITFHVEASDKMQTFFEFKVNDLDEAKSKLESAGCTLHPVTTPEGNKSYLVNDPFGLKFHLFEA